MTGSELKMATVAGIDAVPGAPWLVRLSYEPQQIRSLEAARRYMLQRALALYEQEPENRGEQMPKKMTAADVKAIDWASVLAKLPALAGLILQIVQILAAPQEAKAAGKAAECCDEAKAACEAECDALVSLVVAHLKLHEIVAGDCCE